jgi:hypothetical protein
VIFTNQGGINGKNGYDGTKAAAIKGKVSDLAAAVSSLYWMKISCNSSVRLSYSMLCGYNR